MTDATNTIDSLLKQFEEGIAKPTEVKGWLTARSEIENQIDSLSTAQIKLLDRLDRQLGAKASTIAEQLGDALPNARSTEARPGGHWWWYLDTIGAASPAVGPKQPTSNERLINNIINIVLIGALAVSLFVAGRNLGIIPTPAAPTNTPFPSSTPAPTVTLNPAAFDINSAKSVEVPYKVIDIKVPEGWTQQPSQGSYVYVFTYGDDQNPSALLQVIVNDPAVAYRSIQVTDPVDSPKAALEKLKEGLAADPRFKAGDIVEAKVAQFTGSGMEVQITDGAGGPAQQIIDVRAAAVDAGKVALVIAQAESALWETAKPVLDQIITTMKVQATNIPTATPTATLHPLLMTATAVQTQIIGLTPTATLTPTPTNTPGGTAEATADVASTSEATAAATSAPTAAPTSEATSAATTEATPAQ